MKYTIRKGKHRPPVYQRIWATLTGLIPIISFSRDLIYEVRLGESFFQSKRRYAHIPHVGKLFGRAIGWRWGLNEYHEDGRALAEVITFDHGNSARVAFSISDDKVSHAKIRTYSYIEGKRPYGKSGDPRGWHEKDKALFSPNVNEIYVGINSLTGPERTFYYRIALGRVKPVWGKPFYAAYHTFYDARGGIVESHQVRYEKIPFLWWLGGRMHGPFFGGKDPAPMDLHLSLTRISPRKFSALRNEAILQKLKYV